MNTPKVDLVKARISLSKRQKELDELRAQYAEMGEYDEELEALIRIAIDRYLDAKLEYHTAKDRMRRF